MATFTSKYNFGDPVFYHGKEYKVVSVRFHISGKVAYDVDGAAGFRPGIMESDIGVADVATLRKQLSDAIARQNDDPSTWPLWMRAGVAVAQGDDRPVRPTTRDREIDAVILTQESPVDSSN